MPQDPEFAGADRERPNPGIVARLRAAWDSAGALLSMRGEIFREELAQQAVVFGRGAAALAVAIVLALFAILVLTALVVSLFALLLGSVWAGLLATLVLFLAAAAGLAIFGVKTLQKLELDFPTTRRGVSEDLAAVRDALTPPDGESATDTDADVAEIEERFRTGGQ